MIIGCRNVSAFLNNFEMMRDDLFKQPMEKVPRFEFSSEVSAVFDDMIRRSVPYYEENLKMTADLAKRFYRDGLIYDLGSSTGAVVGALLERFEGKPFRYIGIDNSEAMIEKARTNCQKLNLGNNRQGEFTVEFINENIENVLYRPANVVIAAYTFQFVHPENRQKLVQKIFDSLEDGGVFLLSEKVLEEEPQIHQAYIDLHHRMKMDNGYSELEISQKRDSIENVLVPFEALKNLEMLREAGFSGASIYHKWFNFASYIAVKKTT